MAGLPRSRSMATRLGITKGVVSCLLDRNNHRFGSSNQEFHTAASCRPRIVLAYQSGLQFVRCVEEYSVQESPSTDLLNLSIPTNLYPVSLPAASIEGEA